MELIRNARARGHELPLLVLSSYDEAVYAERALHAGANGYVNKAESLSVVVEGLRHVLDGKVYVSALMRDEVLRHAWSADPVEGLSLREIEVFRLIGEGHATRRIAASLNLSVSTVESHSRNIRQKLGLGSTRDLVRCPMERQALSAAASALGCRGSRSASNKRSAADVGVVDGE
ncbi:MAG: response regulator transcription factor [Thermoanaerobaculia bacterium]